MANIIQFMPKQPERRASEEEEVLIAFMKIRDPQIRSGLCELIQAIVREQAEERSR